MVKKVLMPIANGFEEIEAVTIIDILRRAGLQVEIAGCGRYEVLGAHGIAIGAEMTIEDVNADEYDALVLAGGHENAIALSSDQAVQSVIVGLKQRGKLLAAICAAPIALAQAGAIEGSFTCYSGYEGGIEGDYKNERVVESGNLITSQGPGTAAEFAFAIVSKMCGAEMAAQVKRAMYF
ncbi:4-methyl-5(B-hydroxyethyl)-thiazole monophosphate biosynthesis protein [Campylobacterota bacterium]|nr:4-methyl-5(B-hydroxyethyl)-thiazole monophosphate biosynthesis protein [Campylobacterota bacterium]